MAEFGPSDVAAVLQGVGAIAQAMAIFAAAWIASNTFNGWRKQKLSERRIEQAERILTATYNARDALWRIRNPLLTPHELSVAHESLLKDYSKSGHSDHHQNLFNTQEAYSNRLNAVWSERQAVSDCMSMARAHFGDEIEHVLQTFRDQFEIIQIEVELIRSNDGNMTKDSRAVLNRALKTNGVNEMNDVITEQIKIIEDHLFPILRLDIK